MVERSCEVGTSGKMSLFTDLMGDPLCRIRHSPVFLMLVAEMGPEKEIVGLIRGCIKTISSGRKLSRNACETRVTHQPLYTKLAYILGLRVSSSHRRKGVGKRLVSSMEEWFRAQGAEYSYMATDRGNEASLGLFKKRFGYSEFRTPAVLVQPVFAHRHRIPARAAIFRLPPSDAEALYRTRLSAVTEFFPHDIDAVLGNKLSLGTFLAAPTGALPPSWPGISSFLSDPPESWAVLSVWNCKEVFRLRVLGMSRVRQWLTRASRAVDRAMPWVGIPSVPELFRPFGLHFLYGLGGEGPGAAGLTRVLCQHAHNLAREQGCGVVATEVAPREPLRPGIPHWRRLSCAEDVWCIKRMADEYGDGPLGDWTKSLPGPSIFVDPREF